MSIKTTIPSWYYNNTKSWTFHVDGQDEFTTMVRVVGWGENTSTKHAEQFKENALVEITRFHTLQVTNKQLNKTGSIYEIFIEHRSIVTVID